MSVVSSQLNERLDEGVSVSVSELGQSRLRRQQASSALDVKK